MKKVIHGLEWKTKLGSQVLGVPPSKLDEIGHEYPTDEERESAVVLYWMSHDPLASWRRLIRELYSSEENKRADSILHYAEELTGGLLLVFCSLSLGHTHQFD